MTGFYVMETFIANGLRLQKGIFTAETQQNTFMLILMFDHLVDEYVVIPLDIRSVTFK